MGQMQADGEMRESQSQNGLQTSNNVFGVWVRLLINKLIDNI